MRDRIGAGIILFILGLAGCVVGPIAGATAATVLGATAGGLGLLLVLAGVT